MHEKLSVYFKHSCSFIQHHQHSILAGRQWSYLHDAVVDPDALLLCNRGRGAHALLLHLAVLGLAVLAVDEVVPAVDRLQPAQDAAQAERGAAQELAVSA